MLFSKRKNKIITIFNPWINVPIIPNIAIKKLWTSRDHIFPNFISKANCSCVVAIHLSAMKHHLFNINPLPSNLILQKFDKDLKKKQNLDITKLFFMHKPSNIHQLFFL
jgi:hypothetical protein